MANARHVLSRPLTEFDTHPVRAGTHVPRRRRHVTADASPESRRAREPARHVAAAPATRPGRSASRQPIRMPRRVRVVFFPAWARSLNRIEATLCAYYLPEFNLCSPRADFPRRTRRGQTRHKFAHPARRMCCALLMLVARAALGRLSASHHPQDNRATMCNTPSPPSAPAGQPVPCRATAS